MRKADTRLHAPGPIAPYGGLLVQRVLKGEEARQALEEARRLRRLRLPAHAVADLELIAVGAYSPLEGFMGPEDYRSVLQGMQLASGLPWTIPVTLAVDAGEAPDEGETVALCEPSGAVIGLMHVEHVFRYDKRAEARAVFGTAEERHPGVARLYAQGDVLVGGPVWLAKRPQPAFPQYHLDPLDTRRIFQERGWRRVVAFQTRNPVHRAHEYIQKCALEICDGLLLHPLVGATKEDDVPADVRFRTYEALLDRYYPRERVVLAAYPAAMRYAGPREAVHHAIVRRNYGCTHIVIGRDHAGVGRYYGTYDAQKIFDRLPPELLGIEPLRFEHAFYCRVCGSMATTRTCPHGDEDHVQLSGTRVREMLSRGECPPPEFSRPEVAQLLVEAYRKS
ncbi:MAG: sulfate adenylyltransferase [Clostridia bacterium]|nr:sulfate adenylyltransferase [Clostridia bacterium]